MSLASDSRARRSAGATARRGSSAPPVAGSWLVAVRTASSVLRHWLIASAATLPSEPGERAVTGAKALPPAGTMTGMSTSKAMKSGTAKMTAPAGTVMALAVEFPSRRVAVAGVTPWMTSPVVGTASSTSRSTVMTVAGMVRRSRSSSSTRSVARTTASPSTVVVGGYTLTVADGPAV